MYAGTWDTIQSIIGTVGVTPESTQAILQALASPTLSNIKKVEQAFSAAGTTPPPELMNVLYGRYYDSVASNPYMTTGITLQTVTDWFPWVLGGGLVLLAISKRRKR